MLRVKKLASLTLVAVLVVTLIASVAPFVLADDGGDEGSFDILVFENGNWRLQGEPSFSDYETRELELDNDAGQVSVRLVQHGHDGAYVDYVALQKDLVSYPPSEAINVNGNIDILNKIISPEYDVCDAWDSALEIVWDNVPANTTLVMRAMEEDLGMGHGGPLHYPDIRSGETLHYTLVNDGGIIADGVLEETGEPDFNVFWQPDSPHPDGYTYGWLHCDGEYLYAAVEVTADNTPDEEDWGAFYVMIDGDLEEFRISCDDNQRGTSGFQYTASVIYEHRVYEFQIPLSEMDARIGDEINYGFGCYGTVTIQFDDVWVDDDWLGLHFGDAADGHAYGMDAFAAIQPAIGAVRVDGTVHVHAGTYAENLIINKSLTLQSVSGNWQDTMIDDVSIQPEITISGDADVTVQGFEITAGSHGIYIGPVLSTVNIVDCFIHDNLFDGIHVASSGDVLNIENNIISQNGLADASCGIHIEQAWTTVSILDNIIGGWWGPAQPVYNGNDEDGIRVDDVPAGSYVAIEDNIIVANGDDGIDFPSVTSVNGNVNIERNVIGPWTYGDVRFEGNHNRGIHIAHVSDTATINIEGNAISQNWDDGINFGSGASAVFGRVMIHQNIIGGWTCYTGDYGYSGQPQHYGGNYGEGIYIYQVGASGMVTTDHNKISENGYDTGIYIYDIYGQVTIADNEVGAWKDSHGETYLGNAGDGIYIYWVWPGAVLAIGPHNSIKENTDDGIEVFNAQPAGAAEVTIHHNTIDSNGSNGIELGTPCEVDGATINYNTVTNHLIGIYLTGPSDQNIVSDNQIRDNEDGIVIEGNNNQILRNNILNNQGGAGSGIHIVSFHGSPVSGNIINCNNIVGNLPYGVYYEIGTDHDLLEGVYNQYVDEAVDATGNWWGCIEGPGAAGCDTISGNVIYDPWLLDEFENCRECVGAPIPPGIPAVSHWGIVAMIALFAGLLAWGVRRRRLAS
jgi:parallel beta-helix repeat protein